MTKLRAVVVFLCVVFQVKANPILTNDTSTSIGSILVEADRLSKYRPEKVSSGTFTEMPPENLPMVVDTLTEDFIQERNPTDLHDLLRYVPGIETGGKSLLIRDRKSVV